jgi:quercetin dioxygenase-like cupin family protein
MKENDTPSWGTRPWETAFDIIDTEVVEETPDLRVVRLTLAAGECVPWHWHSAITDRFVCLEGGIEIETRAPKALHRLEPGQEAAVAAKVAHIVRNRIDGISRFLVIQGVGAYDYHPVG